MGLCILKDIDTAETTFRTQKVFREVLSDNRYQIVKVLFLLQVLHSLQELFKLKFPW